MATASTGFGLGARNLGFDTILDTIIESAPATPAPTARSEGVSARTSSRPPTSRPPSAAARPLALARASSGASGVTASGGNVSRYLNRLAKLESDFNPDVENYIGAKGAFQFTPITQEDARQLGIENPAEGDLPTQARRTWQFIEARHPDAADAIKKGDFGTADNLLNRRWTSLPGGPEMQGPERYREADRFLLGEGLQFSLPELDGTGVASPAGQGVGNNLTNTSPAAMPEAVKPEPVDYAAYNPMSDRDIINQLQPGTPFFEGLKAAKDQDFEHAMTGRRQEYDLALRDNQSERQNLLANGMLNFTLGSMGGHQDFMARLFGR